MGKLPRSDQFHLDAAEGWLELGSVEEAHRELESVSFENRTCYEALHLRVRLYVKADKWDYVEAIAVTLARLAPEQPFGHLMLGTALRRLQRHGEAIALLTVAATRFAREWRFAYELACCLCATDDLKGSYLWLEKVFDQAGRHDVRAMALDEPDLEPLWVNIAEV